MQLPRGNCWFDDVGGVGGGARLFSCHDRVGTVLGVRPNRDLLHANRSTLTTVFKAPLVVEGLTADGHGNLYTAGRQGNPCPVWRVPSGGGAGVVVGTIPPPCSPNGLAFDAAGDLFVADGSTETNGTTGNRIYRLTPNAAHAADRDAVRLRRPGCQRDCVRSQGQSLGCRRDDRPGANLEDHAAGRRDRRVPRAAAVQSRQRRREQRRRER